MCLYTRFDARIEAHLAATFQPRHHSFHEAQARRDLGAPNGPTLLDRLFQRRAALDLEAAVQKRANELLDADRRKMEEDRVSAKPEIIERTLSRVDSPRVETYFNPRTGASGYSDLIHPTQVKYINAVRLNLIIGTSRQTRPGEEEWRALRDAVLREDRFSCRICGEYPKEKHVHHIIPLSKFGSNHPNNLVTLCYPCHDKQHPEFGVSKHAT